MLDMGLFNFHLSIILEEGKHIRKISQFLAFFLSFFSFLIKLLNTNSSLMYIKLNHSLIF